MAPKMLFLLFPLIYALFGLLYSLFLPFSKFEYFVQNCEKKAMLLESSHEHEVFPTLHIDKRRKQVRTQNFKSSSRIFIII